MNYTLVIGDYSKSSWSLRAWLILKAAEVPFETIKVLLHESDSSANILKCSPSGKLPALIVNNVVVNDSLAIAETIAEKYPNAKLWPDDAMLRAKARSAAAEMHAGFVNLRSQMPFGITIGESVDEIKASTQWEIDRMFQIWRDLQKFSASTSFLCGGFGIVDAAFAPIIFRFRRFGVDIPADIKSYEDTILNHPLVREWLAHAKQELDACSTVRR